MRCFRITPSRLAVAIVVAACASAGVAHAASLGLGSTKLYAWSQVLNKGPCSPAESDAEIDASSPGTNFGNQSSATVASKNSGSSYVLIGFNLAGSPCSLPTTGGADSAVLTITVTSTFKGPDTVSAYPITSSWNASTVTWNTMPTYGSTADFTFSGAGTDIFTVIAQIDAGIKSGAFYGWMLVDTTGTNNATTTIAGHGSAQAPSIALSYEK
jgi:hypothetical protein